MESAFKVRAASGYEPLEGLIMLHHEDFEIERLGIKFQRTIATLSSEVRSKSTLYRRKRSVILFKQAYETLERTVLVFLIARRGAYVLDFIDKSRWEEFNNHFRSLAGTYPRLWDIGRMICQKHQKHIDKLLAMATHMSDAEAEHSRQFQAGSKGLSSMPPRLRQSPESQMSAKSQISQHTDAARANGIDSASLALQLETKAFIPVDAGSRASGMNSTELDLSSLAQTSTYGPLGMEIALQQIPQQNTNTQASGAQAGAQKHITYQHAVGATSGNQGEFEFQKMEKAHYAALYSQDNGAAQGVARTASDQSDMAFMLSEDKVNQGVDMIYQTDGGYSNALPVESHASVNFAMPRVNTKCFAPAPILMMLSNIATHTFIESSEDGTFLRKLHFYSNNDGLGTLEVTPWLSSYFPDHYRRG